jgi:hypothetical protein
MELAYLLGSNSTPVTQSFFVSATLAQGIPVLEPAANGAGIATSTTTGCDNMLGVTVDASGTYATAQSGTTDVQAEVRVIINPNAVYQCKISGGATENTALTIRDVTTANTDGLVITTGDDYSSPTMDEGAIWDFDGANAGVLRKITSVSATAATVTVAFPNDSVVGDNYIHAPIFPGQAQTVTLTTLLTQMRQDAATATNTAALRCVDIQARDTSDDGRNNSFALLISGNHVFGGVLN